MDLSSSNTQPSSADLLAQLIALESQARRCRSLVELVFTIANQTNRLVSYYQCVVCAVKTTNKVSIKGVSGVSTIDPHTPFSLWFITFIESYLKTANTITPKQLSKNDVPASLSEDWDTWLPENILIFPVNNFQKELTGLIIFSREQIFHKKDIALLEFLVEAYSYSWQTLQKDRKSYFKIISKKRKFLGLTLTCLLFWVLFFVDVPDTVLAPAEIIPSNPVFITSPVSGMVENIQVEPYQMVTKGEMLFSLDETELKNKLELAEKSLQVVRAEHLRAAQQAFHDQQSKADIELFRVQVEEKMLIVRYTREELARQKVTATENGIAIFNDPNDWIGRPVKIGEKVMTLADPQATQLKISLPVDDAISLEKGNDVKLFLHSDPLHPVAAVISRTSFNAEVLEDGTMAYPLHAEFTEDLPNLRIGLQGTAKVYSQPVALFHYLFRKPLTFIRRNLGI